jgi:hypothetical protein
VAPDVVRFAPIETITEVPEVVFGRQSVDRPADAPGGSHT